MKDLIQYLVSSLVEHSEEVKIEEKAPAPNSVYAVHVARADLGKVIGKRGRTAKAIRLLVSAFAAHKNLEVQLEIVEPHEPETVTA